MKKLPDNEIILYTLPQNTLSIEVLYANENVWLSKKKIADLYEVDRSVISKHIKNIYISGELEEISTCADFAQVQKEGERNITRTVPMYSLETIIALGYRVQSDRGTLFRQWATSILREYIQKGFALDSDRFKYGSKFSTRYFDDLLEEIRDIRSSERMAYQKITDIYATSTDYSPNAEITQDFFATVQNKLHFAVTGQTAAEIIASRASATATHMGLTSWRKYPDGKILPADVRIAKNYLDRDELESLNRVVSMYLDYAELQAVRNRPMYMRDWANKLDAFLQFNEFDLLHHAGKVSHAVAMALAEKEYATFSKIQDRNFLSDFDKLLIKPCQQSEIQHIKTAVTKKKST